MISVVEFKAEDLPAICADPVDPEITLEFAERWAVECERGLSYTGMLDGSPIGMIGIIINRAGVGNVWAIFNRRILKHKKTVLRSIRVMLEEYILPAAPMRLRALAKVDFPASHILLEHLGFKRKGLYKDLYLYVR